MKYHQSKQALLKPKTSNAALIAEPLATFTLFAGIIVYFCMMIK